MLDVFKKKSDTGIGTPRYIKARVRVRLRAARDHYRKTYGRT